ncbi:MAG: NAD(P)-dependent dehydrogenase (short-subunit alcohol dehydrogenase family) [Candidatus Azotimanducaceae bacterium]|jgi:NAD(P)-dependent dehydrogenase (short-subunit alcohol dehydrogenase family)
MAKKKKKTIILTGGATGIGAATASRLLSKKCNVIVLDVVEPNEKSIQFIHCDLGNSDSISSAAEHIPNNIDALVNVAGVSNALPGEMIMAVNFLGLRQLSETLLPRINPGGTIVNVASTAAFDWKTRQTIINEFLDTEDFDSGTSWLQENKDIWIDNPYKFSKQCTAAYTYRAVGYAIKSGVRVNCVHPGSTGTQLTVEFRKLVGDALYDWGVGQVGREGEPEDIAEIIEFLSIGECRWLNGVEITADGGFLAGMVGGWLDLTSKP